MKNLIEIDQEYILIPGGKFKYSVTNRIESVSDIYFAKYPVTNKQYRRFIDYLADKESELMERLPIDQFIQKLIQFSKTIKGFDSYLEKDYKVRVDQFRSRYDEDKEFGEDDQPVVGITWYAARAYCLWLSCLEFIEQEDNMYRLPNEIEWEWAAAGREPDGSLREYPWKKEKRELKHDLSFITQQGQN